MSSSLIDAIARHLPNDGEASDLDERDFDSLTGVFALVADRRRRAGARYTLGFILALTLAAVMAGARSYAGIARFAHLREDAYLHALGARGRHLRPSTSRITRILTALDADQLDALTGAWSFAQAHRGDLEDDLVHYAADGKAVRGARHGQGRAPFLVALYRLDASRVVAQTQVAEKTNEVRREALCRIPTAGGRNSEGGSWTRWLTRSRKAMGTRACHEDPWPCPEIRSGARRSPRDMAKAVLPEPQSPAMQVFIHRKRSLKPVPCPASCYLVGDATSGTTGDVQ